VNTCVENFSLCFLEDKQIMRDTIIEAIKSRRLIEFSYDGGVRTVEPHCYGQSRKGNDVVRAFQVGGYSSSGKMGWKLYDLSKVYSLTLLDEVFDGPRTGYTKGDSEMVKFKWRQNSPFLHYF
jgi:hypothetical protein